MLLLSVVGLSSAVGALADVCEWRAASLETKWRLRSAAQWWGWSIALEPLDQRRLRLVETLHAIGDYGQGESQLRAVEPEDLPPSVSVSFWLLSGESHLHRRRAKLAENAFQTALARAEALSLPLLKGAALIGLARVRYHLENRPSDARRHLQELARVPGAMESSRLRADRLRHLGVIQWWFAPEAQGILDQYYQPALEAYRQLNDRRSESIMLRNIGLLFRRLDDFQASNAYLERSRRVAESADYLAGLAEVDLSLGVYYAEFWDYWTGRSYLRAAWQRGKELGHELIRDEAEALLAANRERYGAAPSRQPTRLDQAGGCRPYVLLDLSPDALHDCRRWVERVLRDGANTRAQRLALLSLALVELKREEIPAAREALLRADRIVEPNEVPSTLREAVALSLAARNRGATETVAKQVDRFIWAIENQADFGLLRPFYALTAKQALASLLAGGYADRVLWTLRILDALRQRGLARFLHGYGKKATPGVPSPPPDLAKKQDPAEGRRVLVAYVELEGRLHGLAWSAEQSHHFILTAPVAVLARQTRLLRTLLQMDPSLGEPARAADWQLLSKRMRGILIQPLESAGILSSGDALVFLTGGVFHDLPFPALSRDHLGAVRFLVQDYVLSRATTFETFRREKLHAQPASRKARLAWGVDRPNSGDWGQLRFAQQEVLALEESFGFRARTGRAASEAAFKREAPGADLLHLAVHARNKPLDPIGSAVFLSSGEGEDGALRVEEILSLKIEADLVVLSACESARLGSPTLVRAVDQNRLGLTEAFLTAGARSVVATLFAVDDRATAVFVGEFHRRRGRHPAPRALAETQRAFLDPSFPVASGADWRHPYYWSAFMLTR